MVIFIARVRDDEVVEVVEVERGVGGLKYAGLGLDEVGLGVVVLWEGESEVREEELEEERVRGLKSLGGR